MEYKYAIPDSIDIYKDHKHLFTDKAIEDIERRKMNQMLFQYNKEIECLGFKSWDPYPSLPLPSHINMFNTTDDVTKQLYRTFCKLGIYMDYSYERRIAPVKFFGLTVDSKDKIAAAAEVIATHINNIADNSDCIIGSMVQLSYLPLAKEPFTDEIGSYAVFSYIAIDYNQADENYYKSFNELNIDNI